MTMSMLLHVLIIKGNEYVFTCNEYLWLKELYYFEYKKNPSVVLILYIQHYNLLTW